MKYLNLILFFACAILYGQQDTFTPTPEQSQQIHQVIREHFSKYFQVPQEAYKMDSLSRIRYQIEFFIDKEGKVTDPQIISKNVECASCETAIIKTLHSAPTVEPFNMDGEIVKAKFILPFTIAFE